MRRLHNKPVIALAPIATEKVAADHRQYCAAALQGS
jgi:hypothetical protein